MTTPPSFKLTKIEAARRQLKHALDLYFSDGDPLIVYVLSSAAHEVVHDLLEHGGKRSIFFGSDFLPPAQREKAERLLRRPWNFTKHANWKGDPEAVLDFEPELGEYWLFATTYGLRQLGLELTDIEEAYIFWWIQLHPHCCSETSPIKSRLQIRTPEEIAQLRKHGKRGWPAVYIGHMRKPNAMDGFMVISRSASSNR